jgi:hypothetical protein
MDVDTILGAAVMIVLACCAICQVKTMLYNMNNKENNDWDI